MDNNKSNKKVTKEILRRRQLCALAVIALIVLILIILIANACTDKSANPDSKKKTTTATTATTETTTTETVTETTTEVPTEPITTLPQINLELSAQVQLDKREMSLAVGETDMAYINGYPEGVSEANEVWNTSDPNVATVDNLGRVTAVNAGSCYIILKFNNRPEIEVQIKVDVTSGETTPAVTEPVSVPENPVASIPDVQQNQGENNQSAGSQELQGIQDVQNYQENQGATSPQGFPEVENVNPTQPQQ
ncbi:MAG: Ig-like domain-containing protein [Ruminococcus sp.]|nr:Ig-like domain-containing protein [Ruminococcus sp.]